MYLTNDAQHDWQIEKTPDITSKDENENAGGKKVSAAFFKAQFIDLQEVEFKNNSARTSYQHKAWTATVMLSYLS